MTSDWVHGFGHTPVCKILLQMRSNMSIVASPPALDNVMIETEGTPEEFEEMVRVMNRCMMANDYRDNSYVETVTKRMTAVREGIRKDAGTDEQNFQLRFPGVIYLAHKPR
ncbi:hypothetical protein PoB_004179100 [Plakobranchus ocellatus]|uniref:Uncharacterized protein n=1 Tax=Plakobranchus ocellatus TaxID=259542 RepID=A0AAV4B8X7_9GAST|nr:hypothetical protein PoB_004179100 [Plakobranchus ocellatus]